MYKTTDENFGAVDCNQNTSIKSQSEADSGSTDKFLIRMSTTGGNFLRRKPRSDNMSSVDSYVELKDYCTSCVSFIIFFALGIVIVLWVAALIIDGPVEWHSCVILWPLVLGVMFIGSVFLILWFSENCLRRRWHRRNLKLAEQPIVMKDSLVDQCQKCEKVHTEADEFVVYERHTCLRLSYAFLAFALLCIMIVSDVQYFTLGSNCYKHLRDDMKELLLGYKILAYVSIVVFSILGCFFTCMLFGIVIKCCTPGPHSQ